MTKFAVACLILIILCGGCKPPVAEPPAPVETIIEQAPIKRDADLPIIEREFRAAWVATVANIDWPSERGMPVEEQKCEAIAILDTAVALNLNAIILQVRPQCDALFPSDLEPWSYYLSGEQGKAPEPFYDPLDFWIEEAHDRGLELHAWFNPYRAHHPSGGPISEHSLVKTKADLVRDMENGYHWLDPALKETQDHSFSVLMDVARRYDIDGVHFDDYFYPYGGENFPDSTAWQAYQANGGMLKRSDWRRQHVNQFIERIYLALKAEKPNIKFGISPFGIWRPGNPPSIRGFDQYEGLFADAKLWLNEGWIDYWTPQLYWPIRQVPQSYPVLLAWWVDENRHDRHVWPGMYTGRMLNRIDAYELVNQIMINRGFVPEGPGHIHFSMKSLLRNVNSVNSILRNGPYQQPALAPTTTWLDSMPPAPPLLTVAKADSQLVISWTHPNKQDAFKTILYLKHNEGWKHHILNRKEREFHFALFSAPPLESDSAETVQPIKIEPPSQIAISAVDRMGNESEVVFYQQSNQ